MLRPPSPLLLLWVYDLFFCQRTPCHLAHTHTHTCSRLCFSTTANRDTFPLHATRPLLCLYLMPVAAVVVIVVVVTVTAASASAFAFAIFSLSFGSAVAFAFSFRSCLNATSCADCAAAAAAASASALPRSRYRYRSRSLSRSRRQPLTSVKLNSKYYFLDTLLSGRRRVKQTSCSIRQPAIDIGTHRATPRAGSSSGGRRSVDRVCCSWNRGRLAYCSLIDVSHSAEAARRPETGVAS